MLTMTHTVEIPMRLDAYNKYIDKNRRNKFMANKYKQDVESVLMYYLKVLPKIENPVRICITWVEENRRRDPDNVASAKKFIIDSLVKSGKLQNDTHKFVKGFTDDFEFAKESKIILKLVEVDDND